MIVPNKFINFDSSILSKLYLINEVNIEKINLVDLYNELEENFNSIDEFLYLIDVLYVLNYLEVDFEKGEVLIC